LSERHVPELCHSHSRCTFHIYAQTALLFSFGDQFRRFSVNRITRPDLPLYKRNVKLVETSSGSLQSLFVCLYILAMWEIILTCPLISYRCGRQNDLALCGIFVQYSATTEQHNVFCAHLNYLFQSRNASGRTYP